MNERVAIYVGSFDPLTNGHLHVIERGVEIFDRTIVAVGTNPAKQPMFPVAERMDMIREAAAHLPSVEVDQFPNELQVHYARRKGARFILRGIRSVADYEFERDSAHVNSDLDADIKMWFALPVRNVAEVSSSMVKGLVGFEGWEEAVARYVPAAVLARLKEKAHGWRS